MIFRVLIVMADLQNIIYCMLWTLTQADNNEDLVCEAFLDLRKAYDLLDHCLLLQCLFDLGISGVELT